MHISDWQTSHASATRSSSRSSKPPHQVSQRVIQSQEQPYPGPTLALYRAEGPETTLINLRWLGTKTTFILLHTIKQTITFS